MKKIFQICLIGLIWLAQPTLAADSTSSAIDRKAQDLLDRVATKVATLTSKLRRVYTGKVKSAGTTSYVVTTSDGDRTVTTNDVTNFFRIRAGNRSEINFSAIKVGDDVAAMGTVDPQTGEMTAKQIIAKIKRFNIVGKITVIDKLTYTITELSNKTTKVDLSDAITLKMITTKNQIVPATVENFKEGDQAFVIAYSSDSTSDILSALKAIDLAK